MSERAFRKNRIDVVKKIPGGSAPEPNHSSSFKSDGTSTQAMTRLCPLPLATS